MLEYGLWATIFIVIVLGTFLELAVVINIWLTGFSLLNNSQCDYMKADKMTSYQSYDYAVHGYCS